MQHRCLFVSFKMNNQLIISRLEVGSTAAAATRLGKTPATEVRHKCQRGKEEMDRRKGRKEMERLRMGWQGVIGQGEIL